MFVPSIVQLGIQRGHFATPLQTLWQQRELRHHNDSAIES